MYVSISSKINDTNNNYGDVDNKNNDANANTSLVDILGIVEALLASSYRPAANSELTYRM